MNRLVLRSSVGAIVAAGALMAVGDARAAADDPARCNKPGVNHTACMHEVAAANAAKRNGTLTSPGGYEQNALRRCERVPPDARADCEKRVRDNWHG
jgi:hypothetical protein